ncbi:hypothetical protein ABIE45_002782 [Methylobacterium sp. OAE515]|uniref:hypothetical protein n=1 Tax=Methylobacterium sp. OAE515 TaxID=2817895 RepID=UPI00178A051D
MPEEKNVWASALRNHVRGNPIAILRLTKEEWKALETSRRGTEEFTIAVPHTDLTRLRSPTMCLIVADSDDSPSMLVGVIGRPSAVTTLQSRIKLKRVFRLAPSSPAELIRLLDSPSQVKILGEKFTEPDQVIVLGAQLSRDIVDKLVALESNKVGLRAISASLSAPRYVKSNAALQEQGLRTALRAFGIAIDAPANTVELLSEDETAISRVDTTADAAEIDFGDAVPRRAVVHAIEDGFIEHDARSVHGMDLIDSDATGRAVYTYRGERLEVITANRRPLEEALGVDLIYVNTIQKNVVMVQYKMLDNAGSRWIYRPDRQLQIEIQRMERFSASVQRTNDQYRMHPGIFYMKFVKRNAAIRQGGILLPLDHYQAFISSARARGPNGGLRIDYESLSGCYMREQPFVDLVRAGYIGSYPEHTADLKVIIDAILADGKAVVAAIQSAAE